MSENITVPKAVLIHSLALIVVLWAHVGDSHATVFEFSMNEHSPRVIKGNLPAHGTCDYEPTATEKPFYDRLNKDERTTLQSKGGAEAEPSVFAVKGHSGQFVSWFGIVRQITRDSANGHSILLVENKYFWGFTDCDIQMVEITGAGDFQVEVSEIPADLLPLVLVRVYGRVTAEDRNHPLVKSEYVRVWHWGQFNFSDLFGEDHGNPEWKKRVKLTQGEKAYQRGLSWKYYEERLGPTDEEGQTIKAWHQHWTAIEASDDPFEPKEGSGEYTPTDLERNYLEKVPNESLVTVESKPSETQHGKFRLFGHVYQRVSWFGIVREASPHIRKPGGTLLIENKYFKGSGDQNLQTVSIRGGGDFKAELTNFSKDLVPLTLVRVYGRVLREEGQIPVIDAVYVRLWDLGQYNFEDYGMDKTNSRWTKNLGLQKGDTVYAPNVSADYYIKRLSPTNEQTKMIREKFERLKQYEKAMEQLRQIPTQEVGPQVGPTP